MKLSKRIIFLFVIATLSILAYFVLSNKPFVKRQSESLSFPSSYNVISTTIDKEAKDALMVHKNTDPPQTLSYKVLDAKKISQQEKASRDYGEPTLDSTIYIATFKNPDSLTEEQWIEKYSFYPRAVESSLTPPGKLEDRNINGKTWKRIVYNSYFPTALYYKNDGGRMLYLALGEKNPAARQIISTEFKDKNQPEDVVLTFYRDYIDYLERGKVSEYPWNNNPLLTQNFINNHSNFMCSTNSPKSVSISAYFGDVRPQKIILSEHFEKQINYVEVYLLKDEQGLWKIDSTKCAGDYKPRLR